MKAKVIVRCEGGHEKTIWHGNLTAIPRAGDQIVIDGDEAAETVKDVFFYLFDDSVIISLGCVPKDVFDEWKEAK